MAQACYNNDCSVADTLQLFLTQASSSLCYTICMCEQKDICLRIMRQIVSLRKAKGITQKRMAKLTGLSVRTITRMENNKTDLTLIDLHKMAEALDSTVEVKVYEPKR